MTSIRSCAGEMTPQPARHPRAPGQAPHPRPAHRGGLSHRRLRGRVPDLLRCGRDACRDEARDRAGVNARYAAGVLVSWAADTSSNHSKARRDASGGRSVCTRQYQFRYNSRWLALTGSAAKRRSTGSSSAGLRTRRQWKHWRVDDLPTLRSRDLYGQASRSRVCPARLPEKSRRGIATPKEDMASFAPG